MLVRLRQLSQAFKTLVVAPKMPISTESPASPTSPRAMKRQKVDHPPERAVVSDGGGEAGMTEHEMVEREMALPVEYVRTYEHELDYRNKLVLAPMVRTGSCESGL
jgi:hypothetical protein